jgi:hypothetical protein
MTSSARAFAGLFRDDISTLFREQEETEKRQHSSTRLKTI